MAGKGTKFKFHGAFKKKEDAIRKESTCDCFIRRTKMKHGRRSFLRYLVLEKK
jgi:hypothetical protein